MYRVLLIEPYYGGSHRAWADGYYAHSRCDVRLLTLPATFWKWRMQGGAVTLARAYEAMTVEWRPDVILASDMFNLATFRALTRHLTGDIPIALYYHENQLTYPQNQRQHHGWQYGFINYVSAMAADQIFFNSAFHLHSFFDELPRMLRHFGDCNELDTLPYLRDRSEVLPLGLELACFDRYQAQPSGERPVILWNHRWEEDKNPQEFFQALYRLTEWGVDFEVVLLGENIRQAPTEFEEARQRLGQRILHYGYVEDFATYAHWLWQSDIVVSTAYQDFFGIAVAEAMYCGCVPVLAHRLNYPALLPSAFHAQHLFYSGQLAERLRRLMADLSAARSVAWREYVAQYDWTLMATRYDARLSELVVRPGLL